ncbi:hypothetical protein FQZ97_852020 [compost metagenome]
MALLGPAAICSAVHVHGATRTHAGVPLVAVDAGGAAELAGCRDRQHGAVSREGNAHAKNRAGRVERLHIGLLGPGAVRTDVHVHRTSEGPAVVRVCVPAGLDARGAAVLERRPDRQRGAIGGERQAQSEVVPCIGVRGFHIGLLDPRAVAAGVQVHRACVGRTVVELVAVDAGGAARFRVRPDRQRRAIGRECHAVAEVAARRPRAFHIGLLGPGAIPTGIDVHRTGVGRAVVRLADVDAVGAAVLGGRTDRQRRAIG